MGPHGTLLLDQDCLKLASHVGRDVPWLKERVPILSPVLEHPWPKGILLKKPGSWARNTTVSKCVISRWCFAQFRENHRMQISEKLTSFLHCLNLSAHVSGLKSITWIVQLFLLFPQGMPPKPLSLASHRWLLLISCLLLRLLPMNFH